MQAAIVPFHWMHVEAMDLRDQERVYIEHMPDWQQRVRHQQASSVAFTLLADGVIACSYGFLPMWTGVWEIWALTAKHLEAHKTHHIRLALTVVDEFMRTSGAQRLQATANAGDLRAVRLLKFLRFAPEGVLKAYGPDGSDYLMMARYADVGTVRRGWRPEAAADDDAAATGDAAAAAGKARRPGA